ncbi:hypothetical protein BH11PLA1_BH11PLA1_15550 [soil metagenome]
MSSNFSVRCAPAVLAGIVALGCAPAAKAVLTLTPDGLARGFQLTTFASGFPSSGGVGPLAIDYQADHSILVSSYATGTISRYANVDNQTFGAAPLINYPNSEFAHGIAHIGSTVYVSRYNSQTIVQLNADGSINHTVVSAIGNARALLANPANGHLFVSTVQGIRDIDPIAGTFTTLVNVEADGISLSADGSIIYGALISGNSGHLVGYNTTTGAQVFDSGFVPGGIDGTALGFGPFTGYVYANTNSGTVIEINLLTHAQTVIATGGSRGDFVSSDPFLTGDLLLTQTDSVLRLSGIPAPSSMALLAIGGLLTSRRRR